MKLFTCSMCKQLLFFENVLCTNCGRTLAYLPDVGVVSALQAESPPEPPRPNAPTVFRALSKAGRGQTYRLCRNYTDHAVCNWAVPAASPDELCRACSLNDVIPNLADASARDAWNRLEIAKRRLVYTLLELGLPVERKTETTPGMAFSFMQDGDGDGAKVFTGHSDGLITINIAEADDPFREKMRQQMGETYRTLLGHFRHEIGHYYWDRLVRDTPRLEAYRTHFGDETADYAESQQRHYTQGPPPDWGSQFVSAYASMHPWEDWAETFAHYLHMVDTLETARSYGLALKPKPVGGKALGDMTARRLHFDDFDDLITAWFPLTTALNSLNRGMGLSDLYPFVLSDRAIAKLRFVHDIIEQTPAPSRGAAIGTEP